MEAGKGEGSIVVPIARHRGDEGAVKEEPLDLTPGIP